MTKSSSAPANDDETAGSEKPAAKQYRAPADGNAPAQALFVHRGAGAVKKDPPTLDKPQVQDKPQAQAAKPPVAPIANPPANPPAKPSAGQPGAQGKARQPSAQGPQAKGQWNQPPPQGQGQGQGQGNWQKPNPPTAAPVAAPAAAVVQVRPIAEPATMKRRHWGIFASFLAVVLVPLTFIILYMWIFAEDQYSSTTGFTVRQEEGGGASEFLGGLANLTGSSASSDANILYEFIQSQEIVNAIDARLDLRALYSEPWPFDWAFALWPDASAEDLLWYWQRVVRISYDQATGLIELRALAFDPQTAQRVATEIVRESQDMINALNEQARADAMSYALSDLDVAVERLKNAREALTRFRTRTQIVDPGADIQGRMGVMANLQQQLAEALITYDLLQETTNADDPRVKQALRRTQVIRARIGTERDQFASDSTDTGGVGEDYPSLIAEFESLSVDREFAEQTYRAALTALDVARNNAQRQSRYLATYITPTLSQTAEFPQRFVLTGLAALFLVLSWSIMALVYYSVRDRG